MLTKEYWLLELEKWRLLAYTARLDLRVLHQRLKISLIHFRKAWHETGRARYIPQ